MNISKKIRFEVFKRDGFACQYCGKKSPAVVLEIDHIVPKSEGGGDNIENLTTSCFDCNRGKGKISLEVFKQGTDPTEQAILLLERERQLQEYNEVLRVVRARKQGEFEEILEYWGDDTYWFPAGTVKRAQDYLPKEQILEAIDICKSSFTKWENKSWGQSKRDYFVGILRSMTDNFGAGDKS